MTPTRPSPGCYTTAPLLAELQGILAREKFAEHLQARVQTATQITSSTIHVHALVLDGVYIEDGGILQFHEAMPPTDDEMYCLLATIDRRIHRLLARRGVLEDQLGLRFTGATGPVEYWIIDHIEQPSEN